MLLQGSDVRPETVQALEITGFSYSVARGCAPESTPLYARYLARKGCVWTCQIRHPADLVKDSTLSRIRISLGAMTALQARQDALLMAAAAQVACGRVRIMDEAALADGAAKVSEKMTQSPVPIFSGLDALADRVDSKPSPAV